jgi:hypothetical protein
MSLRDLLVSRMTTPETKKAFAAILDLRDVLADAGVDRVKFMALLEPLSQLCGAYEAVKFTLDTYKITEKERFVNVPKATDWIGARREASCPMHEETAAEHIKNALQMLYSMRTPMHSTGNVEIVRKDLDAVIERLYKALSHIEIEPEHTVPDGPGIPLGCELEVLQDDPKQDWDDKSYWRWADEAYTQFDGYRDPDVEA